MRSLFQSLASVLSRNPVVVNVANYRKDHKFDDLMEQSSFRPKKILILSKVTRYEFEKHMHQTIDDDQLEMMLRRRGSDYHQMLCKHRIHHSYLQTMQEELEKAGVESRVVRRYEYTDEVVNWADAVMTAGGDGTFLLAASRIHQRNKPVIGINTDPQGSEGHMCLMRKLPMEHFRSALHRLLDGDFNWLYRQRIRITLTGDSQAGIGDSIELHDQQLNSMPTTMRWMDTRTARSLYSCHETRASVAETLPENAVSSMTTPAKKRTRSLSERISIQLPVLALNEVFIGESLSSRVSYYEIQIDNGEMTKQKSSGIAICTGTGSTSWYFNINKLTEQCVSELLRIASDHCGVQLPADDGNMVTEICTKFNRQLIFEPDLLRMAFAVRDPIFNATFNATMPRGFAEKIRVKSRGYDAHLVLDGGVSYRFNDGTEALMEMHAEDALQTVVFR